MDDKLTFAYHVDCQLKKANKRLYCIRTMKKLNINPSIIALFYNMTVPPVLMYSAITFYGILSILLKRELDHPRKTCARIVKECCDMMHSNDGVYDNAMLRTAKKIIADKIHPLNEFYNLLQSGRRFRLPRCRTERFRKTFLPLSINKVNDNMMLIT